jgi:hypothetical protein
MIYRSKISEGNYYNIFDAAKYFFKNTGSKFHITTAGWNINDKVAQTAAENFIKYPDCLYGFDISVHPFHRYMQESLKYKNMGDIEKSEIWRNKYIDMISNVIRSREGLKDKLHSFSIVLQYSDQGVGIKKEDSCILLLDILKKLKSEGMDLNHYTYIDPDDNKLYFKSEYVQGRLISLVGRGANYSDPDHIPLNTELPLKYFDLKTSAKMIGPDGKIIVRPYCEAYKFNGVEFRELSDIKLNFRLPTLNLSQPLKKIAGRIL